MTTRYVPLGVVGAICPWNFPLILSVGKIAPALLAGNCIILKPSPYTPYTGLKEVELAQEIFPPGVVQVVGGDDKLGPMLTAHPDIAKISFTGSIATGKKIMAACAGTLKRVTLELGGNDAAIVLPDVDIEKTAPEVAMGAFFNSGQVCVATKRIYIHEKIYRPFVDAMVKFAENLKVGSSDDEGVMMGPIQNAMQYEKVKDFFADSKAKGYNFIAGSDEVKKGNGYFIQYVGECTNSNRANANPSIDLPSSTTRQMTPVSSKRSHSVPSCPYSHGQTKKRSLRVQTRRRLVWEPVSTARTSNMPRRSAGGCKPDPSSSTASRSPHPKPSSVDTRRAGLEANGASWVS